jgi:hypothetical protein
MRFARECKARSMDNMLSKIFSFLNTAFEPKSEAPVRRVDFLSPSEPAIEIEDKGTYPLKDWAEPDGPGYTLDFEQRKFKGPQDFDWSHIDRVLYLPHRVDGVDHELVAIKIKLGPLLVFEEFASSAVALAHMKRIVTRLYRQDHLCSSYLRMQTADALFALQESKIRGRFLPRKIEFGPQRVVFFALMVDFEDPERDCAAAELALSKNEGVVLFSGVGRSQKVCEWDDILDLTIEENVLYYSDSDAEQIILKFTLRQNYEIELRFLAQQIHDDRIPGEVEASEADMKRGRAAFQKLRTFLELP